MKNAYLRNISTFDNVIKNLTFKCNKLFKSRNLKFPDYQSDNLSFLLLYKADKKIWEYSIKEYQWWVDL